MASKTPLLAANEGPTFKDKMKTHAKSGGKYCCLIIVTVFVCALIAQLLIYSTVTAGCGPTVIGEDYKYPGGGNSDSGGPEFNLVPELSMVVQKDPSIWGWGFDCIPANEAGNAAAAQTGTFWRNWGILWYTYTYEDIANSKLTMYMRSRIWLPYMSYTIARCDGTGPTYYFTEGSNWMTNKIRKLFRMNQAQTYKLYADDKEVGTVQEVASGITSLTLNDMHDLERSSALLKDRHFHGDSDAWYMSSKKSDDLPYWVTSMIALPTVYTEADIKIAKEKATGKSSTQKKDVVDGDKPSFLATADQSAEATETDVKSTATTDTKDSTKTDTDVEASPIDLSEKKKKKAAKAKPPASCTTVTCVKDWYKAKKASVKKYVPADFQHFDLDKLEKEYKTNLARVANSTNATTAAPKKEAPKTTEPPKTTTKV